MRNTWINYSNPVKGNGYPSQFYYVALHNSILVKLKQTGMTTFLAKLKQTAVLLGSSINSHEPACAVSALPLSYNNQTTTNPHNPLYVLHRWY